MFPTLNLSYRAAGRIDQARLKVSDCYFRESKYQKYFQLENGHRIDEDKEGQGLTQRTTQASG